MKMRRIKVDLPVGFSDLDGEPIDYVTGWARQLVESVPAEYRAGALIETEHGDGGGMWMEVYYQRPETALDLQNDERQTRERGAQQSATEYAIYQRLKAKYEPVT